MKKLLSGLIVFLLLLTLSCTVTQTADVEVRNNSEETITDFNFSWVASDGTKTVTYETIESGESVQFECLLAEYQWSFGGGTYTASFNFSYTLNGTNYEYDSYDEDAEVFCLSSTTSLKIVTSDNNYTVD